MPGITVTTLQILTCLASQHLSEVSVILLRISRWGKRGKERLVGKRARILKLVFWFGVSLLNHHSPCLVWKAQLAAMAL